MDSRWRNLGILLVIVVIAAGAYYYLSLPPAPPADDFPQNYDNLSLAWKSEGLDKAELHSDFDALMALPESTLNKIRSNLLDKAAALDDAAAKELANIYTKMVAIALSAKEIQGRNEAIDSSDPVCSNLAEFKSINSEKKTLQSLVDSFNSNVESFAQNHPSQAASVGLNKLDAVAGRVSLPIEDDDLLLGQLEAGCA